MAHHVNCLTRPCRNPVARCSSACHARGQWSGGRPYVLGARRYRLWRFPGQTLFMDRIPDHWCYCHLCNAHLTTLSGGRSATARFDFLVRWAHSAPLSAGIRSVIEFPQTTKGCSSQLNITEIFNSDEALAVAFAVAAGALQLGSQRSISMVEFSDGLIQRVYSFPSENQARLLRPPCAWATTRLGHRRTTPYVMNLRRNL